MIESELMKCDSRTCECQTDDAYQPLGEIPELPSIVAAVRSIDAVADELVSLTAANAELQAENELLRQQADKYGHLVRDAVERRDAARAEVDNLFPLLRAAETQNAKYACELDLLSGAQARADEFDEELAAARNEGFDEGYKAARDEMEVSS